MNKAKADRNKLIAKLYDPERRNGQQLANRFGVSRGRITQIVKEYSKEKIMSAKYTDTIPMTMIEPEKSAKIRSIADKMGLSLAVLVRWGIDAMIEKYEHLIADDMDEISPRDSF